MPLIYLPELGQAVDIRLYRIQKALQSYDERLTLGSRDGQLTVFVKMPHGQDPWPVFGLASVPVDASGFPHPDEVVKRVARADTKRRTSEILDQMNANNDAIQKAEDQRLLEIRQDGYERLERELRHTGISPGFTSYRPRTRG